MKYTLATLMFLASFSLFAQDEERAVKIEQDGIVVTYEFNLLKGKRAEEGPKELCIFIKNNNDYDVEVKFSLAFFKDGFVDEESGVLEICAKSGKEVKGKKLGLCWLITEENDEKIKEGTFAWELNELAIEKVEECD